MRDELWAPDMVHCPTDSEVKLLLLIQREPRPDFAYWPGRRLLAALDAVAWPAAIVLSTSPFGTGNLGGVFVAIAAFIGVRRLCRALWVNQRYQFTTWIWGKRLAGLLLLGFLLKVAIHSI